MFNLTEIFVLRLFKMSENLTECSMLEQRSVIKWAKHRIATMSKRQSMEWKHTDSLIKKKFQVKWLVKNVMLTVFWNMQGPTTIDFFEKGTIVNSISYCQLLR